MTVQRRWLYVSLALPLTASGQPMTGVPVHEPIAVAAARPHDGSRDFDFLLGRWRVHNRELRYRLAGSHDWIEFEARDSFHLLPGNLGTEENYRTNHWKHYFAIGLHLYDPVKRRWTLYWADSRNAPGTMQTLAVGKFSNGTGAFYAPDTFDGRPILVRILWKRVNRDHARWEQAFSTDRGRTWETNWTMDFTRQ